MKKLFLIKLIRKKLKNNIEFENIKKNIDFNNINYKELYDKLLIEYNELKDKLKKYTSPE